MNKKKIKIGLIGLGTVGQGVVKVLSKFDDIEIVSCAVKNLNKKRDVEVKNLATDVMEIVKNPHIDIVVEVAGGIGVKDALICAIENKKHIVTANKELLARHGAELFDCARENKVAILYEAAVAGGIPIIQPIKTSLKANEFDCVAGILNGTTNYILTKMEEENLSYDDCLKKAQNLGYAETDPTNDVEGFDAMFKIAILANIVFNKRIDVNKIYCEGITKISPFDIKSADELGYKIKLIAQAKLAKSNKSDLDIRVHPMLIEKNQAISEIKNATNAVMLSGFPVDKLMFTGPGAGEFPTTSSVVGDILQIKSELDCFEDCHACSGINHTSAFSDCGILPMQVCHHSTFANQISIEKTINSYYLRIEAKNILGIIGQIGLACAKYGINLSSILQKGINENGSATIIVVTEDCLEENVNNMITELEKTDDIKVVNKIRVM